jgi:tetratricopeptide (TPR) repeat protein
VIAGGGAALIRALCWAHRIALITGGLFVLWSLVVLFNGALDPSTAVEHDSEVLAVAAMAIDPGLGGLLPHTRADLRSWRSPGRIERLVLAPAERQHTWIGQPVRVRVHAGLFRIAWVSEVKLDEVRHARQVLAISPAAFHAMKRLFIVLLERQEWGEAFAVARRFAATYPHDVSGIQYVAGLLGIAGRYADQIELIEPLVARGRDYRSMCMLGFALDRSGDHHRAIEVLKEATRLEPGDFFGHHYLGEAYQALERYEEAIEAYQVELRIRPRSLEVRRRVQVFQKYLAARDGRVVVKP